MRVLLSIKPEYANKIFNGKKKYEYRKSIFKKRDIKKIIVYASSPVQKVIGEFDIETIIAECPEIIWEITHKYSGITKNYYDQYTSEKEIIYAIKIKAIKMYKKPLSLLKDLKIKYPPQSFAYL